MKFIKQDLLTLLIGLFLLASCKSANTIGLDIDPNEAIVGDLVDTLTVRSRTQAEAPSSTIGLIRYPLGYMEDPLFGPTEASVVMGVGLPNESFGFGKSPVLDSAVLVVGFSRSSLSATGAASAAQYTELYGDTTNSVYSIDVRQLDNNLRNENSFLSNKEWAASSTVIGNFTGKIKPNTSLSITDIVTGAADTAKNVAPQIRIKLNNAFISNEILELDSASLKYNERFSALFRGLKMSINKASSTGSGGIMFLNFAAGNSKLELYYKRPNATTATNIDTVRVEMPIAVNSSPVAATIKRDYAGTPIETQLNNPSVQYPVTYLQGLNGLKNKISFPGLNNLKAALGKVIINKAELVIDVSAGTDVNPFSPAPRLALYRYDIAERRQNIPDNNPQTQANPTGDPRAFLSAQQFGGFYDAINKRYRFIVTFYIQDLLDGKTQDYGTFLSTTGTGEHSIAPPLTSASRSVIGSAANANNKMKLNIYYTKIK